MADYFLRLGKQLAFTGLCKDVTLDPDRQFLHKIGIWTGVLKNVVLSYFIWYHDLLTSAIIERHAKFYQHRMKNVHVEHIGTLKCH